MKKKVILFTLLTVMIVGTTNGEQFNYTWKNAEGVLNITDYPPPDGIEIIDISVIRLSNKKPAVAPVVKKQNKRQNQNATQDVQLAASLRKEEEELRQKAANLADEAQELQRIGNRQRHKRSWRYRANLKVEEANELTRQADSLSKKANALER